METLTDLSQTARNAFYWTSFDPDGRGARLIEEFTQVLNDDLIEIETASEEQKTAYIAKFRSLLTAWLHAEGNCISSFITGSANFPVRRAEKARNSAQNKYNLMTYWRKKAKKAILKSLEPEKTYETEIERYKKDLENRKKLQEIMKQCNAIIRKAKGTNCTEELVKTGISIETAHKIQRPDFANRIGFAQFNLTNNLANIKRIEDRIKELEGKEQKAGQEIKEIPFTGGIIVVDYSIDRVQIKHDTKPEKAIIDNLKHSGFRWSPSNTAWQRQITPAALYSVQKVTGINIQS